MAFHSFPACAFFQLSCSVSGIFPALFSTFRRTCCNERRGGRDLEEFAEYHPSDEQLEQEPHSLPFGGYHFTVDQSTQIQDVRPAPGMKPSFFGMVARHNRGFDGGGFCQVTQSRPLRVSFLRDFSDGFFSECPFLRVFSISFWKGSIHFREVFISSLKVMLGPGGLHIWNWLE